MLSIASRGYLDGNTIAIASRGFIAPGYILRIGGVKAKEEEIKKKIRRLKKRRIIIIRKKRPKDMAPIIQGIDARLRLYEEHLQEMQRARQEKKRRRNESALIMLAI